MPLGLTEKFSIAKFPHAEVTKYKPSIYNYFVEHEDTIWAANFFSGSFMQITPATYAKVQRALNGERDEELEDIEAVLIEQRFMIPEPLDEMSLLKTENRMSRFSKNRLTMVIAPTLRCNFGCDYCYVDLNANKMKPEDRVKLGKFFAKKLPRDTAASIVWTGGDPSLATDVVEDLSHRFLDAVDRKNCTYMATMITNGYLLHDEMRQKLRSSSVKNLQISLDGSREFHDQTRHLPNGKPTYDRILDNVEMTCDDFEVMLRINVDGRNKMYIGDLLDDLEQRQLKERIYVYFAHVDNVNVNSIKHQDYCLAAEDYAKVEAALLGDAVSRGFRIGGRAFNMPTKAFCGANSINYFVVDSKVNLLKCYHDLGQADKHGIGHIDENGDEVVTNPYNLMRWLGWDPFEIEDCRNCKVLPLCMGGCSHKIMHSNMKVEHGCLKMRFTMDEIIDLFGKSNTQGTPSSGCSGCAVNVHV